MPATTVAVREIRDISGNEKTAAYLIDMEKRMSRANGHCFDNSTSVIIGDQPGSWKIVRVADLLTVLSCFVLTRFST